MSGKVYFLSSLISGKSSPGQKLGKSLSFNLSSGTLILKLPKRCNKVTVDVLNSIGFSHLSRFITHISFVPLSLTISCLLLGQNVFEKMHLTTGSELWKKNGKKMSRDIFLHFHPLEFQEIHLTIFDKSCWQKKKKNN